MSTSFDLNAFLAQVRAGELEDDEIIKTLRTVTQAERLAYYKAMQRHEVILPSLLMPAVLRDVNMTEILAHGGLPATLLDVVDLEDDQDDEIDLGELLGALQKEPESFTRFMNAMVMSAIVEPKVTLEGGEDSLSVDELSQEDKDFIVAWVNRGAKGVRSFRHQEDESD